MVPMPDPQWETEAELVERLRFRRSVEAAERRALEEEEERHQACLAFVRSPEGIEARRAIHASNMAQYVRGIVESVAVLALLPFALALAFGCFF
jgi:hypothetical protein